MNKAMTGAAVAGLLVVGPAEASPINVTAQDFNRLGDSLGYYALTESPTPGDRVYQAAPVVTNYDLTAGAGSVEFSASDSNTMIILNRGQLAGGKLGFTILTDIQDDNACDALTPLDQPCATEYKIGGFSASATLDPGVLDSVGATLTAGQFSVQINAGELPQADGVISSPFAGVSVDCPDGAERCDPATPIPAPGGAELLAIGAAAVRALRRRGRGHSRSQDGAAITPAVNAFRPGQASNTTFEANALA